MPVAVSYPGVYVQELPSGVRTIVGVGTSVGMFLGRTKTGQLNKPVQCLNYEDFTRAFSSDYAGSDLARAVRLFFSNGGTQCYVMRIAKGALPASIELENEAGAPTLKVEALAAGLFGNDIRVAVSYNTQQPEATFNLEIFRWAKTAGGVLQKTLAETYVGLSMQPNHPRHAVDAVNKASALIKLTDKNVAAAAEGFSQSGFAVSSVAAVRHPQWKARFGKAVASNRFRLIVDGNAPVEIDLSSIDFDDAAAANPVETAANIGANLGLRIKQLIDAKLPAGASVGVALVAGPVGGGVNNATTEYLKISSANGDVLIEPASSNDLAAKLMLGTAYGGLEVSKWANRRPAPTGYTMTSADVIAFAARAQNVFNKLNIDGVEIDLSAAPNKLATSAVANARMFQDKTATNEHDGRDGVREKMAIMAAAIIAKRAADPSFVYTAEVWGNRLAIVPVSGADNAQGTIQIFNGGALVNSSSLGSNGLNVRYYSLGTTGTGTFQSTGAAGNDGIAPDLAAYDDAYKVIDREVDLFNLMVLPKDSGHSDADTKKLWGPASVFCQQRRAFLLIDPSADWSDSQKATDAMVGVNTLRVGVVKDHAAVFYPNLKIDDNGKEVFVGPSGAIAGLMARIDSTRGVWKAPAGTEADLRGVLGVERRFSDGENGVMNPRAINTIRVFPNGIVNWGARTLDGDDGFASEYKYIPIRRLALFMEESLYRGLKWAVFEPNDEPLWGQIRLNVGAFMHNLFRQGAFQGATPREAYFVKCDASTTTQNDRNLGIVNVVVGFAPLKPAEFVVLYLQQMAGQIQT